MSIGTNNRLPKPHNQPVVHPSFFNHGMPENNSSPTASSLTPKPNMQSVVRPSFLYNGIPENSSLPVDPSASRYGLPLQHQANSRQQHLDIASDAQINPTQFGRVEHMDSRPGIGLDVSEPHFETLHSSDEVLEHDYVETEDETGREVSYDDSVRQTNQNWRKLSSTFHRHRSNSEPQFDPSAGSGGSLKSQIRPLMSISAVPTRRFSG